MALTKADLQELARANDVEIAEDATKAEIAEALEAAGVDTSAQTENGPSDADRLDRVEQALTLLLRGEASAAVAYFLGEAGR